MDDHVLYKPGLDRVMKQFYIVASRETSIQELSPIIEQMRTYDLLDILMKDPTNDQAKSCIREFISRNQQIPRDFLAKFLSIINLKINLSPNNTGFLSQSYNAKVIANNIRPPNKITVMTLETRKQRLNEEIMTNVNTYVHRNQHVPPESVRFKFDNELLKKCINTMGDLNRIIHDGNRANGYVIDDYIQINMTK